MSENRCWICLVDKTAEDDPTEWSTPCSCSLIAHKDVSSSYSYRFHANNRKCLLVWVQSKLTDDPESAVSCPQCGEHYTIATKSPALLRPMRIADKLIRRVSPLATFAGLGVGLSGVGALYGAAVTRAVLGPLAAGQLLNKPTWSWTTWSSLSIVPWAIMFYNSEFPDKFPATYFFVIPYSYFFPLNPVNVSWPPSPLLTLACVPPVRALYGALRTRLNDYFLTSRDSSTRGPRRETFSIAGAEFQLQYGVTDEDGNAANNNEEEDVQFRYKLTLSTICRYLTTTLAWPFASRLLSDLLLNFRFLHPLFGYSQKLVSRSTIIPLCLRQSQNWEFANDPVWLRTAIAAAFITFAADATKILFTKLELFEKQSRSVENKKITKP